MILSNRTPVLRARPLTRVHRQTEAVQRGVGRRETRSIELRAAQGRGRDPQREAAGRMKLC